jgi:hypothetical protein
MKNKKFGSDHTMKLPALLFFFALFFSFSAMTAIAQGTDYWTTTGNASATEDETNPARPTYTNQTAAINGGPLGYYVLRYNVTSVDGLFNTTSGFMRLRLRDNGTGAQVLVALRRSSIMGGGVETVATFDSDSIVANSGFQTPDAVIYTHLFDFTNYAYWLEVTLIRLDESGAPGFGGAIVGTYFVPVNKL